MSNKAYRCPCSTGGRPVRRSSETGLSETFHLRRFIRGASPETHHLGRTIWDVLSETRYLQRSTSDHRSRITGHAWYNPLPRGVAQPGSVPAWGAGGREFKSHRPDQSRWVTADE